MLLESMSILFVERYPVNCFNAALGSDITGTDT
jgi:hypothetical protein